MEDLSILGLGSNAVTLMMSIGTAWAVMKYRVDRLEKQFEEEKKEERDRLEKDFKMIAEVDREQWVAITRVRDWQAVHEKDSATTRLDLEKELGRIREDATKYGGKIDTLISMITELSSKIEKLEEKLEKKD